MADGSDTNYAALRAECLKKLADAGTIPLVRYELATILSGWEPPGESCVATPSVLRDNCELGVVGADEMPFNLALNAIEKLCGPSTPCINLQNNFNIASGFQNIPVSPENNFQFLNPFRLV